MKKILDWRVNPIVPVARPFPSNTPLLERRWADFVPTNSRHVDVITERKTTYLQQPRAAVGHRQANTPSFACAAERNETFRPTACQSARDARTSAVVHTAENGDEFLFSHAKIAFNTSARTHGQRVRQPAPIIGTERFTIYPSFYPIFYYIFFLSFITICDNNLLCVCFIVAANSGSSS